MKLNLKEQLLKEDFELPYITKLKKDKSLKSIKEEEYFRDNDNNKISLLYCTNENNSDVYYIVVDEHDEYDIIKGFNTRISADRSFEAMVEDSDFDIEHYRDVKNYKKELTEANERNKAFTETLPSFITDLSKALESKFTLKEEEDGWLTLICNKEFELEGDDDEAEVLFSNKQARNYSDLMDRYNTEDYVVYLVSVYGKEWEFQMDVFDESKQLTENLTVNEEKDIDKIIKEIADELKYKYLNKQVNIIEISSFLSTKYDMIAWEDDNDAILKNDKVEIFEDIYVKHDKDKKGIKVTMSYNNENNESIEPDSMANITSIEVVSLHQDEYDDSYYTNLSESLSKLLESMSPEDEKDSALLRNIYDKIQVRSNAKLTQEEKDVLDKYNLATTNYKDIIVKNGNHYNGDAMLMKKKGDYNKDKINYADRARKMIDRKNSKNIDGMIVKYDTPKSPWGDKPGKHVYSGSQNDILSLNMQKDLNNLQSALNDKKWSNKQILDIDDDYKEKEDKLKLEIQNLEKKLNALDSEKDKYKEYHYRELEKAITKINQLLKKDKLEESYHNKQIIMPVGSINTKTGMTSHNWNAFTDDWTFTFVTKDNGDMIIVGGEADGDNEGKTLSFHSWTSGNRFLFDGTIDAILKGDAAKEEMQMYGRRLPFYVYK